jgi:hypothetical protein
MILMVWDTMTLVNLTLCGVILTLGVVGYHRKDSYAILYIGTASDFLLSRIWPPYLATGRFSPAYSSGCVSSDT